MTDVLTKKVYTTFEEWWQKEFLEAGLNGSSIVIKVIRDCSEWAWNASQTSADHKYIGRLCNIGTAIKRIKDILSRCGAHALSHHHELTDTAYTQIMELIAIIERPTRTKKCQKIRTNQKA